MASKHNTMLLYCESSLHAGTGQGTGTIDLPIQRERHTGFPKIESSALRGAIRENIRDRISRSELTGSDMQKDFVRVFGSEDNGDNRSAINFGDARLLLFPVRSWKGVFAWVTCPFVLQRFAKDISLYEQNPVVLSGIDSPPPNNTIYQCSPNALSINDKALLEEYLFDAEVKDIKIGEQALGTYLLSKLNPANESTLKRLEQNIAIVSDEVFRDFVEMYTEKITRNKISTETGTVVDGGLFNEEFLPAESILYAYVGASNEFSVSEDRLKADKVMQFYLDTMPPIFQAGGDANIGKGILRSSLIN